MAGQLGTVAEGVWQDLRFSIRMLAKSPGFTAVAILSLALGIGANSAIFTLINELMLKALPVRAPDELVAFGKEVGGGQIDGITPGPLDIFPYDFYQRLQRQSSPLRRALRVLEFFHQRELPAILKRPSAR